VNTDSNHPQSETPSLPVLNDPQGLPPLLTDDQAKVLAEARVVKWTIEAYEFSYNSSIRSLIARKRVAEYASYALAVIFLFFQYVAKENWPTLHTILSYTGVGLGIVTVLVGIWGHLDKWDEQIDKKKELATQCRVLATKHYALTLKLPPDESAVRRWMIECHAFEGERQHVHGSIGDRFYRLAHQHVGNTYPDEGVKCKKCNRIWSHELNRKIARLPWGFCPSCGVKYD
jgi:hypothetical protein